MKDCIDELVESYKKSKAGFRFFDANCWIGSTQVDCFKTAESISEIVNELARFKIDEAVVSNMKCLEYNPLEGNIELIEKIGSCPNLYGSMVLVPEAGFSGRDIRNYIDRMMERKIVIARMFPRMLYHSMNKWQIGEILSYMEYKRLPLMLWHTEVGWDTVQSICDEYRNLPVIIEGNDKKLLYHNRFFIPLLQKLENLYIETHNLIQYMGIDCLANTEGIHRMLFGSYFPFNDPNASMMMVTHACVSEKLKNEIAGGNLRMLIDNLRK